MAHPAPASQTLSRGIRILEVLAEAREPLSIDELARRLEVHRSVAYRLLRTLEDHGLVTRSGTGHVQLGARLAALAAGIAPDLQAEALPELTAVANELGMTSLLAVLDHDQCVTLASVEPRNAGGALAQHPGSRHPVTRGAPGKAILSLVPESAWPGGVSETLAGEIRDAAARGFAVSHDEVIPTVRSVAVALDLRGRAPAALAVVYVASAHSDDEIAARLERSSAQIRAALGG